MLRSIQRLLLAQAVAWAAHYASAFSLLGPLDTWQTPTLNYSPNIHIYSYSLPGGNVTAVTTHSLDIGGPMNLGEEYRWNIKTITYGFDESFLNYFGAQGTAAVMQAIAILNNLPPISQMSADLSEFPLETKRVNYQASALNLIDLKSHALGCLLNILGATSPERYVWTLRDRVVFSPAPTNYMVIMRNFDPVTWAPSRYVNGTLYTYAIEELPSPPWQAGSADAIEIAVDPLAFTYTTVVSAADGFWGGVLGYGEFFTGLTRDDVGALRYLYRSDNYNIESLIAGTTGSGSTSPWTPIGSSGTTNFVNVALRPGVDKITFKYVGNQSVFGNFVTVTQQYTDTFVTNSTLKTQNTQRVLTQPDILFAAADLGGYMPLWFLRTVVFVNNDALNGQIALAGPGQIEPPVVITFNKVGPWLLNQWPYYLDEASGAAGFVWGSFDGTANPPVIYPIGTSIQDLERWVLHGY